MPPFFTRSRLAALMLCALPTVTVTASWAQTPAVPNPPKAVSPKPLPPKPTAAKPVAAKPHAAKRQPAPPPEPVLAEANDTQLAAAELAYLGDYSCEFKQAVLITKHPKVPGYINVAWQKQLITMKPVLSSTGALRLEDVTGRTLMIQIANKSMLLDTKLGQRLLDECIHPEQARLMAEAQAAKIHDPEAEAAASARNSLGITPGK